VIINDIQNMYSFFKTKNKSEIFEGNTGAIQNLWQH